MLFNNFINLLILETTISIVLFIACLRLIFIKHRQKLTIENLNLYNKTLSNMYDGISSMKHDFINFIQCLKGYTLCDDMCGVKEMVDSVYNESRNICNMEILNPKTINNPAIYNLLVNKYQDAHINNILMNIEVEIDFQEINLDTYTICRILGILIDNAIDAAKECDKKIIFVRFIQEEDYKKIIVENSYEDIMVDLNMLFKKGYSTKYDGHGLGLWRVRKIVDGNNNLELRTYKSRFFTQELKINDAKKIFLLSKKTEKELLN